MADVEEGEIRPLAFIDNLLTEVRLKIYHCLFVSGDPIEKVDTNMGEKLGGGKIVEKRSVHLLRERRASLSSQFLRTCSTVKNESLSILLGKNTFVIDTAGDINRLKDLMTPSSYALLQRIRCSDVDMSYKLPVSSIFARKLINQQASLGTPQ